MVNALHKDHGPVEGIHVIHNWNFNDSTARLNHVYTSADVGKVARQADDGTFWVVTSSAPTFVQIGGVSNGNGSGDVVGPISSTNSAIVLFDGITGKLLKNSSVTIDNSGNITTSGTVDGVDVSTHAARHLPNGLDALTTATPISIGTSNTEGIANSFARSDHLHNHGDLIGGTLHATATISVAGFMSADDKTKLDGIASGAQVNQNTYANISDGTNTATAAITTDTVRFRSNSNLLSVVVGSNDPTHGDNVLFTVNENNILHNNLSGLTSGDPHTQYALSSVSSVNNSLVTWSGTGGRSFTGNNAVTLSGSVLNFNGAGGINAAPYVQLGTTTFPSQGAVRLSNDDAGAIWSILSSVDKRLMVYSPNGGIASNDVLAFGQDVGTSAITEIRFESSTYQNYRINNVDILSLTSSGAAISGGLNLNNNSITNVNLVDGVDVSTHADRHQNNGADEINVEGLSGLLADPQNIIVRRNSGANIGTRNRLNFIQGTGTSLSVVDDNANNEVDITIATDFTQASYQIIQNPAGAAFTQRYNLQFAGNVTVTDDAVNNRTIVDVTGLGGTGPDYYLYMSDGTTTATASAGDTFRFRGGTGINVVVTNNDPTFGDNALISIVDPVVLGPASATNNALPRFDSTTGKLIKNSIVTVDDDGIIETGVVSVLPTTPSTGRIKLYGKRVSGRSLLNQITSSGRDIAFQPIIGQNKVSWWSAQGNGTTVATFNFGNSTTGTATSRTVATTNLLTSLRRIGYVSGTAANNSAGTRHNSAQFWRGNVAGLGGFHYIARFGTPTLVATTRFLVAMSGTTGLFSQTTEPSTFANFVGVGFDSTDSNWQIMHNDGAGNATKIDLGVNFPDNSITDVYEVHIFCPSNSNSVWVYFTRLNTNFEAEIEINTDLPSNTTLLSPQIFINNAGTAASVAVDVISQYIEVDY